MDFKEQIKQLVDKLNDANYHYYVLNSPVMSDYDFDMELKKLERLEAENNYILPYSPTQRIGSDLQSEFKNVERTRVMGSIANVYDKDELQEWVESFGDSNLVFTVEPKYDGTSCSLIYKDGILVSASTRGNGYIGSDITQNVKTIKNIPLKLSVNEVSIEKLFSYNGIYVPTFVEVRGEILMPKSVFNELNKTRKENGLETFANERNAAAGSLKQLDPSITAERKLIFKPYYMFVEDTAFSETYLKYQYSSLDIAEIFGFDSPLYWNKGVDEVVSFLDVFESDILYNQDYCMDGCVVKVSSLEKQNTIGYTQKVPKWAKAFKFKQEQASTKLLGVELQMGMSGQISFVGILDPTEVDGSVISKVTLNNMDYIRNMDLHIGDYVFIQKNGAVIPGVVGVDYDRNDIECVERIEINTPSVCPFCGHELVKKDADGAHYYCSNKTCSERVIQKINHFCKKECMDIDGISLKTIRKIYELGLVKNWYDLYSVTYDDLVASGFGEKTSLNIINQVEKSKTRESYRILMSLGIPMIGRVTARKIMRVFGSIKKLKNATLEEISSIDGVGEVASMELIRYFVDNSLEIDKLSNIFKVDEQQSVPKEYVYVAGKKFEVDVPKKYNDKIYNDKKDVESTSYVAQPAPINQPIVQSVNQPIDQPSNQSIAQPTVQNIIKKDFINGKRILATGKLNRFTRSSIIDSVENNGGIYASTISPKLDYLIVGESAGPAKLAKAEKYGIKMITETEYINLIS